MSRVDLKDVDLNHLVALDVLLEDCQVSKAAARLGMSQPAMSRTLSRLRETFGDPLLVRVDGGFVRTARAEEIAGQLKTALSEMRRTFEAPAFDPATATGVFTITALDYVEIVLLPAVMKAVRTEAPGLRVEIIQRAVYSIEQIVDGEADLCVGLMPSAMPKYCILEDLFEDRYVCVMHKNHPSAKAALTVDSYLQHPHSIIHTGKTPGSFLDDRLRQMGYTRTIAKRSPHFLASLFSLGETDMLQTVPKRLADALTMSGELVSRELPFELNPLVISQVWHARDNGEPLHQWFRRQITLAAQSLPDNV